MTDLNTQKLFHLTLRLSCFLIFIGRAWQHLVWDAPFRAFFWDQDLLEGVIILFSNLTWFDYATSPSTDVFITVLTRGFGLFYLFMAIVTLIVTPKMKFFAWLYLEASIFLAVLALLYCKEKFYHTAQFFEYSIQFLTPLFFYYFLFKDISLDKLVFYMKVAVAATFISHGMYAFGYYPRPGVFIDMTINIMGVNEYTAHQFLKIAGILDFIVGVGIFLPRVSNIFLAYCVIWGLATAIARTLANVNLGPDTFGLLNQYLNQTLYRLPHGLIPLAIYFAIANVPIKQT